MIGLDTNVLVRYLMQDDARQSQAANRLLESLSRDAPGFVSLVALVELTWVLESAYGLDRAQIARAVENLLRANSILVERDTLVQRALRRFRDGTADFADCLIASIANDAGCSKTMTFDRVAAKTAQMTLLTT